MDYDLTVTWTWKNDPFEPVLQRFYWRVSGSFAATAGEAATELWNSIKAGSNWLFYFRRLWPISSTGRSIQISVQPSTCVLSYTVGGPEYAGTRLSPFFNGIARQAQARIGWLTDSTKRLGYSQFPWLSGSDFSNGIIDPFTWPAFNDFGMVHSTNLVGNLGDELIPCVPIHGEGFLPIRNYIAYRQVSRQLHRRGKV